MEQHLRGLEKFFNPETLKTNLITASLYQVAWESLEDAVVGQLKGFYWIGFDENGENFSSNYQSRVLSRHKSPFRASLLWFLEMEAIEESDLELADRLRDHRNEIAHTLPEFIASGEKQFDVELFVSMIELISKIDKWWIREIEIPTNSDFDYENSDLSDACSGRMLFLNLLLEIALGNDEQASKWYKHFVDLTAKQ